jgi:mannosyltransferase OCH1-like enzyme
VDTVVCQSNIYPHHHLAIMSDRSNKSKTSRCGRDVLLPSVVVLLVALTFVARLESFDLKQVTERRQVTFETSGQRTPLTKLTGTDKLIQCADGFVPVPDTVLDPALAFADGRKIPRVVHVTSKSRCMTKEFAENVDKWRFKDHSLFMHDDDAMNELLSRHWPEFPQLQQVQKCLKYGGAVKADIWRALILYEYGGIYTDTDNAPNKFNGTTIQPEDDAFFVVDVMGVPSQWFMVLSPRHPLMYMLVETILYNIAWNVKDTGKLKVIWTTGPGALADAFRLYTRLNSRLFKSGHYVGTEGRSVRIMGNKTNQDEYVSRNIIRGKEDLYEKMNMTHLTRMGFNAENAATNLTCLERLYQVEEERKGVHENTLQW